ncbi:MAG TPA: HEPN domain-containing protein [Methanosarcinaceae archaeon]|nr:HEPN domain-containing protein [Methanosarcinaceae archaeon]
MFETQVKDITVEKTHDLTKINNACISVDSEFEELSDAAEILSGYTVEVRYPCAFYEYSIEEAREAVEKAKMFKVLY